jgi:hypothetical protein
MIQKKWPISRSMAGPLITRAVRNRENHEKKAKLLASQGKVEHAAMAQARANYWKLELNALQKKAKWLRLRSHSPRG